MHSLAHSQSPLAQASRRRVLGPAGAASTVLTPTHAPAAMSRSGKISPAASPRRTRTALRPAERDALRRLLTEKYEYMDHEWFDQPEKDAYQAIFLDPDPLPIPDVSWYHPLMDPGSADAASLSRSASGGSVLLTAAQERVLFTQFNFCRKKVCEARDRLLEAAGAPTPPTTLPRSKADSKAEAGAKAAKVNHQTSRKTSGKAKGKAGPQTLTRYAKEKLQRDLLDWYARAEALRTQIADTNLALVLAMAKRSRIHPGDFADLISEGNMALLRAADKFDVGRGFKFSTYACRAILKAFSRQGIKLAKHRGMFPVDFDPKLERSNYQAEKNAAHEDDCADEVRLIVADNRAELSPVERTVVAARFNVGPALSQTPSLQTPSHQVPSPQAASPPKPKALSGTLQPAAAAKAVFSLKAPPTSSNQDDDAYELPELLRNRTADAKPLTLEQVGKLIGVTKERVRQIQNKALEKIRATLEEQYLG